MSFKVPFEYLAAAVLATAHKDVRFYLEGVLVGNGIVAGTNGHIAIILEDEILKDVPQIIIPKESILWMIKKMGRNFNQHDFVTIGEIDEPLLKDPVHGDDDNRVNPAPVVRNGRYVMSYNAGGFEAYEIFRPIDGKFPDVMRVLKIPEVSAAASPLVNFSYMKIIAKAKQVLTGSRTESISMRYTSQNEQIYFPLGSDKWHGIIMPMRSE